MWSNYRRNVVRNSVCVLWSWWSFLAAIFLSTNTLHLSFFFFLSLHLSLIWVFIVNCNFNIPLILQITGIPVAFISALEGKGRIAVMRRVLDTYEKWCLRLPTARLNRWLRKVKSVLFYIFTSKHGLFYKFTYEQMHISCSCYSCKRQLQDLHKT